MRTNVSELLRILVRDRDLFEDTIIDSIVHWYRQMSLGFTCSVVTQPDKVAVYATLIGLINTESYEYGEAVCAVCFE